ncbi:recombinase family protein [Spirosoma oryzicola]|uniref:recombinase family protein n=1 Tax=Spirosoma oryzicola TaxID=2898794 RepID=UPI001E6473FC|nr:recombinase family protein [Spirosoma oryzicola]UHG90135.1 recombinase family protein [Spirosoma oryzicola]
MDQETVPVALFVRVSKKSQSYERQVLELTRHAERLGYKIAQVVHEKGSATKRRNVERPELEELLQLCRKRTIKKILVTEFTRLGRRRGETPQLVEEITELGVSIYAHNLHLETLLPNYKRNPVTNMILAVMVEMGAQETERLSERIISGQEEARNNGVRIGRPIGSVIGNKELLEKYPRIVKDLKAGLSIRQISAIRSNSKDTVQRVKKALNSNQFPSNPLN